MLVSTPSAAESASDGRPRFMLFVLTAAMFGPQLRFRLSRWVCVEHGVEGSA